MGHVKTILRFEPSQSDALTTKPLAGPTAEEQQHQKRCVEASFLILPLSPRL